MCKQKHNRFRINYDAVRLKLAHLQQWYSPNLTEVSILVYNYLCSIWSCKQRWRGQLPRWKHTSEGVLYFLNERWVPLLCLSSSQLFQYLIGMKPKKQTTKTLPIHAIPRIKSNRARKLNQKEEERKRNQVDNPGSQTETSVRVKSSISRLRHVCFFTAAFIIAIIILPHEIHS